MNHNFKSAIATYALCSVQNGEGKRWGRKQTPTVKGRRVHNMMEQGTPGLSNKSINCTKAMKLLDHLRFKKLNRRV